MGTHRSDWICRCLISALFFWPPVCSGGKASDYWGRPECTECTPLTESRRGVWSPAGSSRSTSFRCTSILNRRNSLNCRAGDPVLPWGPGAKEDVQQAINECQVSIYNQTPSERCVHIWILLQVNVSVCIEDDQEVETIGHKTCWRARHCCGSSFSSFYAMQILPFTFLLSAPRLSVLNDVGFVHRCVYLSLSSVLWPSSWSCLPASRCSGWFQAASVVPLTLDLRRDAIGLRAARAHEAVSCHHWCFLWVLKLSPNIWIETSPPLSPDAGWLHLPI